MPSAKLSLLVLKTRQLENLREFYESLGCEFAEEQHGTGPRHYAAQVGEAVLEIYPLANEDRPPEINVRLGFMVENVAAVMETLATQQASVVRPPTKGTWGLRAVVRDPDGRAVELVERE